MLRFPLCAILFSASLMPWPASAEDFWPSQFVVAVDKGCEPPTGLAKVDGANINSLTATNECGQSAALSLNKDGSFAASGWNTTGVFDKKLRAIFWDNGTAWISKTAGFPYFGKWRNLGVQCQSGAHRDALIGPSPNGILAVLNECSMPSRLGFLPDGQIVAYSWGGITGNISRSDPNHLIWSNGSVWERIE